MAVEKFIARLGAVLILRVGLLCMGSAFLLISFTQQFPVILIETALFGFGFGLVSVAQNVAVAMASQNPNLQRQLFSGLHSMYALASLCSPVLAGYLFSLGMSWSDILFVSAFVPAVVLLGTAFLPLKRLSQQLAAARNSEETISEPALLSKAHAYFFSVSMSVYLISEISVSSRMVVHVRRLLGIDDSHATLYLTGFFVCLLSGRVLFAVVDFSRFQTHHLMNFCLFFAGIFYSLGLIFSPWWLAASGLFMAPFFPLVMDYAVRVFAENSSRVIAYCMAFASLSVVFMHYGLGAASDRYGLHNALWVGPASLFLCLTLFALERRIFHR